MNVDELGAQIDTRLWALPNPNTPSVRAVRASCSRSLAGASRDALLDLAGRLGSKYGYQAVRTS